MLQKAGFEHRPGKGSHQVWKHPLLPHRRVVFSKADGDDAPPWLEKQVMNLLKELENLREKPE